jgi:predicted enzyme related to lactoylglutathione lyase
MRKTKLLLLAAGLLCCGAAQAAEKAPAPEDGALARVEGAVMLAAGVPSSDLDRSIAFYTKGLGLISRGRVEMGSVTEAPLMFPGGGTYIILLKPKQADTPITPRGPLNRIILNVPDVEALAARLTAAGYALTGKINRLEAYKVAVGHVVDPDGNHIELVQRLP